RVRVVLEEGHACALAQHLFDRGPPDAARAARDHRDLAGEPSRGGHYRATRQRSSISSQETCASSPLFQNMTPSPSYLAPLADGSWSTSTSRSPARSRADGASLAKKTPSMACGPSPSQ